MLRSSAQRPVNCPSTVQAGPQLPSFSKALTLTALINPHSRQYYRCSRPASDRGLRLPYNLGNDIPGGEAGHGPTFGADRARRAERGADAGRGGRSAAPADRARAQGTLALV